MHARRWASARSRPGLDASPMGPMEEVLPAGTPLQDQPRGQPLRRFIIKYSWRIVKQGSDCCARAMTSSHGTRLFV